MLKQLSLAWVYANAECFVGAVAEVLDFAGSVVVVIDAGGVGFAVVGNESEVDVAGCVVNSKLSDVERFVACSGAGGYGSRHLEVLGVLGNLRRQLLR